MNRIRAIRSRSTTQNRRCERPLGCLAKRRDTGPTPERMDQPSRIGDRFNGGLHRRRFVQDGDIPVTVLRRDQGHEAPAHRGIPAPAAPTSSRLQRTEAALAAETAAREKAERSLAETQSVVRDLQTKIGHAELAKNEAIEALRQERETLAHLRSEGEVWEDRLQEALEQARAAEHGAQVCQEQLADEQHARKAAEKALRVAESARESAEQLVQRLSEEAPAVQQAPQRPRRSQSAAEPAVAAIAEPAVVAVRARRGRPAVDRRGGARTGEMVVEHEACREETLEYQSDRPAEQSRSLDWWGIQALRTILPQGACTLCRNAPADIWRTDSSAGDCSTALLKRPSV